MDSLENFSKSFPIFHQSTFVRRVLLENNLFDLKYNICADYNQLFSLYKQGYVFKYIPQYISIIMSDGVVCNIFSTVFSERVYEPVYDG